MSNTPSDGLPIAVVSARTGVSVATLRQWEHRHGFPRPERLPGGHRRYTEADVTAIARVVAEREAGRTIDAAIGLATQGQADDADDATIFAGVRRRRPDVAVHVLDRRAMLAVSRAIEDECTASGASAHLVAAFQRADTYRTARNRRWAALSRTATSTVVFADFSRSRIDARGVREVAIPDAAPLAREWSLVCDAPTSAAVLAGWERDDGRFEALWTVEPGVVRTATEVARALAGRYAPGLELPEPPASPAVPESAALARAVNITNRVVAYLGDRG